MTTWKFFIPGRLQSLNRNLRMHWAVKRKLQEKIVAACQLLIPMDATVRNEHPRRKIRLTMIRKRLLDRDNAYGAVKPMVDGLKTIYKQGQLFQLGVIYDDSDVYCDLEVKQFQLKDCPKALCTGNGKYTGYQKEEGTWVEVDDGKAST